MNTIQEIFGITYEGVRRRREKEEMENVFEEIKKEVSYYKENGLDRDAFERIKRANFAHLLRMFNSTDDIANEMVSALFDGLDILDYPEICAGVTFEDVTKLLHENFCEFTLSEIHPLQ